MGPSSRQENPLALLVSALAAVLCGGVADAGAQEFPPDPLRGLSREWQWVDFGPDSGLPGGAVHDLFEADSLVWVRTEQGVAFYDGFSWQSMGPEHGVPRGNPTGFTVDSTGAALLIVDGTLLRGGGAGFHEVALDSLPLDSLPLFSVIVPDGGPIMVRTGTRSTPRGTLYALDGSELRVADPPGAGSTGEMWRTRAGAALVDTDVGLFRWTAAGWQVIDPAAEPIPTFLVAAEAADGTGFAFRHLPRTEAGLYRWGTDGGLVRMTSEGDNRPLDIDVVSSGLAVFLYEGTVRYYAEGRVGTVEIPSIRSDGLHLARISNNGDLWLGTARGLHLFRASRQRWGAVRWPFPDPRSRVHALLVDRTGHLWMGTGGGVNVHDRTASSTWYREILGQDVTIVTGLAEDTDGRIWITSGSAFQGALRWDGEAWLHLGAEDGLVSGYVHRVFAGRDGSVWFAGLGSPDHPDGAGFYRFKDGQVERWGEERGLPQERSYAFADDEDGSLWFGSAVGLHRWKDGVVTPFGSERGLGLPHGSAVFELAFDPDERLWYARHYDIGGMGYVDTNDAVFQVTPPGQSRIQRIWSMAFEDDGSLWMGTEAGLVLLRDGNWTLFDSSLGLAVPAVWPVALIDDAVLAGTTGGGIASLSRDEEGSPPPRVLIDAPIVGQGGASVRWSAFAYWGEVRADEVETRFRVDESDWSLWSTDREILLPGLSPGDHDVEVQAKGLFGQLSEPSRAAFRILPPLLLRPVIAIPLSAMMAALLLLIFMAEARRRRHAVEIQAREQRLRSLVESAPEAIGIFDVDQRRFVDVNQNALRVFKMSREELLSKGPAELSAPHLPLEDAPGGTTPARVALALSGESQTFEWVAVASDGEEIPCELSLTRLPTQSGAQLRVSLLDIRERKRAELEREELEVRLHQSQKLEAVGQLTGGVAHDFNNLLTVVLGNLELLLDEPEVSDDVVALARSARNAAGRGAELTQRLLAFARRQALAPKAVRVDALVAGMLDLLRRTLGETISIQVQVPSSTWAVEADPGQLENVLLNLSINARDAMPAGGTLSISARNQRVETRDSMEKWDAVAGDYVRLAVQDTGGGMTPEVASRAFEPFFTTKETGRGSGLGLSMCYGFARQSGGTALIDSAPGRGTEIAVYLPRAAVGGARVDGDGDGGSEPLGAGEVVLVVEDDPALRALVTGLLKRLGYRWLEAADGPAALDALQASGRVDLLFTDVVLPLGMNGVELARRAQLLRPGLPVLYTSGYAEESVLDLARDEPGFDLVRKPYRREELARKLRGKLDRPTA